MSLGMTKKTFDTFASDWTQCTNVAFDKILKKFQLQNAGHKVGNKKQTIEYLHLRKVSMTISPS